MNFTLAEKIFVFGGIIGFAILMALFLWNSGIFS